MKFRWDFVVVILISLLAFYAFILLMDSHFTNNMNEKQHRFDKEWREIYVQYSAGNDSLVIDLANNVLAQAELGTNDMRATSYKAMALARLGRLAEARQRIEYLFSTYPMLRYGLEEKYQASAKDVKMVNFISDVIIEYNSEDHKRLSNSSILNSLKNIGSIHLLQLIALLTGTLAVYEKVRRKYFADNE